MESPSVQTSTTSPVVAPPRCQSMMAQASSAIVSTTVIAGMSDPQLFEIAQAAAARRQFPVDGRVKAVVLVSEPAKRPHQRHVVDDVDHFAVDGGGLVGEIVMQRLARGRQAKHRDHHDAGDRRSSPAAIGRLTVPISAIAATVAMHGGNTFQTNMFSTVKTALEVAVMRLVSIPGSRSEK